MRQYVHSWAELSRELKGKKLDRTKIDGKIWQSWHEEDRTLLLSYTDFTSVTQMAFDCEVTIVLDADDHIRKISGIHGTGVISEDATRCRYSTVQPSSSNYYNLYTMLLPGITEEDA